jgi:hypothetical protein
MKKAKTVKQTGGTSRPNTTSTIIPVDFTDRSGITPLSWPVTPLLVLPPFNMEKILNRAVSQVPAPEVFNFEKKWHLIKPFLNEPKLVKLLDDQMNACNDSFRQRCVENGRLPDILEGPYDRKKGPWFYGQSDYWYIKAERMVDKAEKKGQVRPFDYPGGTYRRNQEYSAAEIAAADPEETAEYERYDKFAAQFYPQPDSPEWYQNRQGGEWLAPWLLELGKLVFPKFTWHLSKEFDCHFIHWFDNGGDQLCDILTHSVAYGMHGGKVRMVFDILNYKEDHTNLIKLAFGTDGVAEHCCGGACGNGD